MHLSGVWLEEKIEIFYIRQNNIQILISQLTVEWHCENNLYSLRSLFLKKKSKYVYICIGGIFFFPFPYFDFQNYLHQICIPSIVQVYQIPHPHSYLYLKNDISEMV